MGRLMAHIIFLMVMAVGPAHSEDKGTPARPPYPAPADMEIIAVMEILKLMDLAEDMDMVEDMEYLVEENQHVRTTD